MKRLFSIVLFLILPLLLHSGEKFTIALLSDMHIDPLDPQQIMVAEKAIDEINGDPQIDLVAVTGDLTNSASVNEFILAKRLWDRITKAKIIAPGNHEMQWGFDGGKRYADTFGATPTAIQVKGIPIFALNTSPSFQFLPGHIRSGEMEYLKTQLAANQNAPFVIVTGHYSPNPKELPNWFDLPRTLQSAGVKKALILSGHIHRFYLMRWLNYPGITARALRQNKGKLQNPPGYVLIRIAPDHSVTVSEKPIGANEFPPQYKFKLGDQKSLKNFRSNRDMRDARYAVRLPVEAEKVIDIKKTTTSQAAVWRNILAAAGDDGSLQVYDLNNNKLMWQIRTPGVIYGALTAGDGVIAAGMANGMVAGFNITDGKMLWSIKTDCPVLSPGVLQDGVYYTGVNKGEFAALEMSSGKVLWRVRCGKGTFQAPPAISGDLIVTPCWDEYVYALDRKNGKLLWKWRAPRAGERFAPGNSHPMIGKDRVILSSFNGGAVVNAADGKEIFKFKGRESLGISADGKTGFTRSKEGLLAFDLTAGKFEKRFEVQEKLLGVLPFPMLEIKGKIWAGTSEGKILIFNAASGKKEYDLQCGFSCVVGMQFDGKSVWVTLNEGKILKFPADVATWRKNR